MKGIRVFIVMVLLFVFVGCAKDNSPALNTGEMAPQSEEDNQLAANTPEPEDPGPSASPKPEYTEVKHFEPMVKVKREGITPVKLEIPVIQINTKIEAVGLLENGQMDVPESFDNAGWFEPGIKPGNDGNAVIAGHEDHYTGPAIFYNLKDLKSGDKVFVFDAEGKKLTYTVKSSEYYKANEAPVGDIFGNALRPKLNLITCAGKFNKKKQESALRLVVYTELLELPR